MRPLLGHPHRAWLLGLLAGMPVAQAQQANVTSVQRQDQAVQVRRAEGAGQVRQADGTQAARAVQQALNSRRQQQGHDLAETRRRQQQAVLARSIEEPADAAADTAPPGVDESSLWALLKRHDLTAFDRQLARSRAQDGLWTPSAALLAERARQQKEAEIERVFAYARSGGPVGALTGSQLQTLVRQYPQEFSCQRIDRLWSAAEIFARAGRKDDALALYRSVFPDCTPADNRIATLYMAQQILGADSDAVAGLIALEQQGGQRDAAAQARLQRILYDRQLTRLAALDPASAEAARALPAIAADILSYRDVATATLAGWIMLGQHQTDQAQDWFQQALQWQPGNVDAQMGLLQIRLDAGDIGGAQSLLALPEVAADPRARGQRARLALLRADRFNQEKDADASLAALDEAERLGATRAQTTPLRAWALYGKGRHDEAASLFATQYRATQDARMAEGWALSENARGRLDQLAASKEAQQAPLSTYVLALQSQQSYYRKQFVTAHALQQRARSEAQASVDMEPEGQGTGGEDLRKSVQAYLHDELQGLTAASLTLGASYANHAGVDGQGHLETLAPTVHAQWFGGADQTRQYDLRLRSLRLQANVITPDAVARALGTPATAQQSGLANVRELWFGAQDSVWLTELGRLAWQGAVGVTDGGVAGTDLHGQASVGQQTAWGSWNAYAGSNPVRDSLLSWRGQAMPGSGQWWGDVRRTALGAKTLWQFAPRWSMAANAELASFSGHNVQSNRAVALDLGAGYDLKLQGFDYFNVGPALHYLHYANNQNQYGWGLGGYYSPQRSLSTGIATQFLTPEGRQSQLSGNLELGWNTAAQSAAACLPVAYRGASAAGIDCAYAGSTDRGAYAHVQMAAVKRLAPRWQLGVQGDVNLTPGRDRQYAAMVFLRYFFEDRAAVFSRDLPTSTRDFSAQMDDGR